MTPLLHVILKIRSQQRMKQLAMIWHSEVEQLMNNHLPAELGWLLQ